MIAGSGRVSIFDWPSATRAIVFQRADLLSERSTSFPMRMFRRILRMFIVNRITPERSSSEKTMLAMYSIRDLKNLMDYFLNGLVRSNLLIPLVYSSVFYHVRKQKNNVSDALSNRQEAHQDPDWIALSHYTISCRSPTIR